MFEDVYCLTLFKSNNPPTRTIKAVKITHCINIEVYITQHQGLHKGLFFVITIAFEQSQAGFFSLFLCYTKQTSCWL